MLVVLLFAACWSQPPSPESSIAYLEALGDAIIRVDGTAALRKYAPEAIKLIDMPTLITVDGQQVPMPPDGIITLAEVKTFFERTKDPAHLAYLAVMVREIIEARREKKKADPLPSSP